MGEIAALHDPCPLPDKQKKRSLNERERLMYAPMSGEGGRGGGRGGMQSKMAPHVEGCMLSIGCSTASAAVPALVHQRKGA